jgi:rod shape-determining protein MreC
LTLLLLVLSSLTLITLDFRHSGPVEKVRNAAATVFSPVGSAADSVFRPVGNAWNSTFHYDRLKKENQRLREQLATERGKQFQDKIDRNQLEQILKAENIQYIRDLPRRVAQVSSGPLNSFSQTIEINRGAGVGIKVGMPVVTPDGLVGKIVVVEGDHSIVQLITSPDAPVDVSVVPDDPQLAGTTGIARGTGPNRLLRIDDGIVPTAPLKKNDIVATSGANTSIYPSGIPVGKITSFRDSPDGTQKVVDLQPSADLKNLSYVTVILWQPGT